MPVSPASDSRELRSGFTVVELMVSIVILTVLVAMLAVVFQQVSTTWRLGEGNIERRRGARALTDYIGAELQSAALPAELRTVAGKGNLQFVINPPLTQVPVEFRNADAVFWTAPLATDTSFGEIAEIGYFVRWVEADARSVQKGIANPRPALCRFFVNPSREQPQATGEGGSTVPLKPVMEPNPNFKIYSPTDPNEWLSKKLFDDIAPAKTPAYAGLFGENVVGLWVEAFGFARDARGRGDTKDVRKLFREFYSLPTQADDLLNKKTPNPDLKSQKVGYLYDRPYGTGTTRPEICYLPARVRISIVQVDSHHIQRLDPVWDKVQALTRDSTITNAEAFMTALRDQKKEPRLATLIPGLRTYTTEVQLQNAR